MTLTLGEKKCREGLNVCMNYEFNLLHHVGVVAKRVCAAAAETAPEGDDNTSSGPTGRGAGRGVTRGSSYASDLSCLYATLTI